HRADGRAPLDLQPGHRAHEPDQAAAPGLTCLMARTVHRADTLARPRPRRRPLARSLPERRDGAPLRTVVHDRMIGVAAAAQGATHSVTKHVTVREAVIDRTGRHSGAFTRPVRTTGVHVLARPRP